MAIPTQQTISNGAMANDGTGDSLRDAADKINNNFASLWQSAYNSSDDWPGKSFVVGTVTDAYSKPSSGVVNAYSTSPTNMKNFVNFRISQSDQLGSVKTISVQKDWNGTSGIYDSVTTATTLTMYQKASDSSLGSYKVVGQYTGNLYFKTKSNPPNGTSPIAGDRFPTTYIFAPDSSDYWWFDANSAEIYGDGSLSAGDSCFIKIDKFW